ncbi:hypothetical protein BDV97DRAFT_373800 [Delphinella strobiligena]|nr:hypothetical protein BDV97DRAFT_373800 [Delphinella strobiligena]
MVSPDVAKYGLNPWGLIVVSIPFLVLVSIAVPLRVWVRVFMTRSFGWDDGLLVASYLFFIAESALTIESGTVQLNQGIVNDQVLLGTINGVGISMYILGQVTFKLSLAVLFLKISMARWQRWIIISSVAIFIAYYIALLFVTIFQCGNPANVGSMTTTCWDWATITGPLNYIGAVLNAIVDWIFAITPIIVISKLTMGRQDKLSVICVILVAISGSIISVVRIPYISGLNPDASYYSKNSNRIVYASVAESGVGLTAASLAVMRPLGKRIAEWARPVIARHAGRRRSDGRERDRRNQARIDALRHHSDGEGGAHAHAHPLQPYPPGKSFSSGSESATRADSIA